MTAQNPNTEVEITEVFPSGMAYAARIHAADCRDIDREYRQIATRSIGGAERWTGTYTGEGWLETNFGDVSADEFEEGTPEWRKELRYQASEVHICNCAKVKGFGF